MCQLTFGRPLELTFCFEDSAAYSNVINVTQVIVFVQITFSPFRVIKLFKSLCPRFGLFDSVSGKE